jgi:hypothetical protein
VICSCVRLGWTDVYHLRLEVSTAILTPLPPAARSPPYTRTHTHIVARPSQLTPQTGGSCTASQLCGLSSQVASLTTSLSNAVASQSNVIGVLSQALSAVNVVSVSTLVDSLMNRVATTENNIG